ncbi:MAG: penicillin-binding protein 2 [Gemmatimonadota bacterium]|nr:MAG: penicillin-binding protein 2 [Gemmatimonadota bacterium]
MSALAQPPRPHQETRGPLARWFVAVAILALGIQFFRIQILKHSTYALRSDDNRIRELRVEPARGTLYDRTGRVVAENVPGYAIVVLPLSADSLRVALEHLGAILGHPREKTERLYSAYRQHPNLPVVVENNATFAEVSAVEERRAYLPGGIVIEAAPKRHYPWGATLAHVVGYVGEISEADLALPQFEGYEPGRIVGQTGIERAYDRVLAGSPGKRYVEVNALGRLVGDFRGHEKVAPVPGSDLHLNIDLALQMKAAELFPDTLAGAFVALEPKSGSVLVLYSAPEFDPNAFVGGIDPTVWNELSNSPGRPLFNRAVSAAYAPGSTFKLVLAALAINDGYAGVDTRMPIPCRGALLYYGRVFKDWTPIGHGALDLNGAIRESCDVYFYQLGLKVGLERILTGVRDFGFGRKTGIDLQSDIAGVFPPSSAWYDERYGASGWTNSVVLNLAIGQGENAQSVLKMAQFYAALAADGVLPRPRLVKEATLAEPAERLPLADEQLAALRAALVEVVNAPSGTARASRLARWTLAGKTGTAQNPHGEDHAWFIGFAPAEEPAIVAAVVLEGGGSGSAAAAPLAAQLIEYYLASQSGLKGSELAAGG